jgi:hypothetical protein
MPTTYIRAPLNGYPTTFQDHFPEDELSDTSSSRDYPRLYLESDYGQRTDREADLETEQEGGGGGGGGGGAGATLGMQGARAGGGDSGGHYTAKDEGGGGGGGGGRTSSKN